MQVIKLLVQVEGWGPCGGHRGAWSLLTWGFLWVSTCFFPASSCKPPTPPKEASRESHLPRVALGLELPRHKRSPQNPIKLPF